MLKRRTIMLGILFAAVAAPFATAADAAARAFVASIYDAYKGKNGNGVALDSDSAVRRRFEPSLAALIRKDQKEAARRDEVGTLDFDPFVDAQDWDIAAVDIAMNETAPDKATATVNFTNSGKPITIVLDLVKIKNDWRIGDITWQRDGKSQTLRGLFAH